ncbi:hypothetical protein BB560_000524 [Smittium megazygosporum]|uniref:Translation initiation factor beta propellor-like domain-containing protein n=1 Tax=Smittium megazygosporum TaxID=133381 RepID=A0A2T9ZK84_9FUNG|nr:hypothetical protein BB560_000524 [Smittium megazygosporum]
MELSSVQVNYLVYRYLRESGFLHSSYTFRYESQLDSCEEIFNVEPGRLIRLIHRGLLYMDVEGKIEKLLSSAETLPQTFQSSIDEQGKLLMKIAKLNLPETDASLNKSQPSQTDKSQDSASGQTRPGPNNKETAIKQDFVSESVLQKQNDELNDPTKLPKASPKQELNPVKTAIKHKSLKSPVSSDNIKAQIESSVGALEGINSKSSLIPDSYVNSLANNQNLATVNSTQHEDDEPSVPIDILNNDYDLDNSQNARRSQVRDEPEKSKLKREPQNTEINKKQSNEQNEYDSDTMDIDLVGEEDEKSKSLKRAQISHTSSREHQKKRRPKVFGNVISLKEHNNSVFASAWNPVMSNVLASGGDGTAIIWTLKSPENSDPLQNDTENKFVTLLHKSASTQPEISSDDNKANTDVTTVSWCKEGTLLATGCFDGKTRIWNLSGKLEKTLSFDDVPIILVRWSPSSKYVLSGNLAGSIFLWDVQTGEMVSKFEKHSDSIMDISWNSDEIFASCSADKSILVWSVSMPDNPIYKLLGHKAGVNSISWHKSGNYLASGSDDSSAKVWEFVNAEKLIKGKQNTRGDEDGADEDGKTETIVINGEEVDLESGEDEDVVARSLLGHEQQVYSVEWLPNSQNTILATASFDGSVRVWDTKTGNIIRTLYAHSDPVHSIAFSPDGRYLISGSFDKSINLWSLKTGLLVRTYTADGGVFDVRFNISGRIAASVSNGCVVVLDSKA